MTITSISHYVIDRIATKIKDTMPIGIPVWIKANGRPTIPPPIIVLIRVRAPSLGDSLLECSTSGFFVTPFYLKFDNFADLTGSTEDLMSCDIFKCVY